MATKKDEPIPGSITNVSGSALDVPALATLCDPPRFGPVAPKEEVQVSDVRGFDTFNWKVKAG